MSALHSHSQTTANLAYMIGAWSADQGHHDDALSAIEGRFARIRIFPDVHGRFIAPDRSAWQVAPLDGVAARPGLIYARRPNRFTGANKNGMPTGGFEYRWFPLADCTAFGASVSS